MGPPVEVWPENWPICELFSCLGTQWRVGMAGPTGLDYAVLFRLMDEAGLTGPDWQETFHLIRVMESAALDEMRPPDKEE
jgi:hypothetical protein